MKPARGNGISTHIIAKPHHAVVPTLFFSIAHSPICIPEDGATADLSGVPEVGSKGRYHDVRQLRVEGLRTGTVSGFPKRGSCDPEQAPPVHPPA